MTDASGINTDAYQAELQAAADSLVAVFPKDFQADFKVYDFGFYLHNESYSGGYPEAFAQAIADVSAKSSYYLLFGKQTDHSGVYTKFWVDTGYIRDYEKGLISSPLDNIYDLPNTFEDLIVLTRKYFPFMAGFVTMRYTAGVIMGNQKTWDE